MSINSNSPDSKTIAGDAIFLFCYFIIAFYYFYDCNFWAGSVNIGSMQYGDAAFWWSGALQFSEGILKENANITFRMGYAIFAGIFAAIFGSDYFLFHKFLVAIFLCSLGAFYFSIKPFLGRVLASFSLIFLINPYLAERLALSTSDSVGLIFSI